MGPDEEDPDPVCEQGETRQCVGAGACAGGQLCGADGLWGECDCGGDDTEPSDDGSGGAGGASSGEDPAADAGAPMNNEPEGEYTLGPPLIVTLEELNSGEIPYVHEPEIGLTWLVTVGGYYEDTDADGEGERCVSGEALQVSTYDDPGAVHRVVLVLYALAREGVDPNRYFDVLNGDVAGFAFELSGAPSTGVLLQWATAESETSPVSGEALEFGDGPIFGSGEHQFLFPVDDTDFVWTRVSRLRFAVHTDAFEAAATEPQPYDFCVSNIRPILRPD